MPLSEKELMERDAKRDIGAELLEAIRQVKLRHAAQVRIGNHVKIKLGAGRRVVVTIIVL